MSRQGNEIARPTEYTGCLSGIVRFIWLMAGNAALFLLTALIVQRKALSSLDIAFWVIVCAVILIRFIDITRMHGLTADGDPASLQHWRRYVLRLLLIGGGVWVLAHGVARFLPS